MRRRGSRLAVVPVVLALLAASCGKDRESSPSTAAPTTTGVSTTAATTAPPPTESAAGDSTPSTDPTEAPDTTEGSETTAATDAAETATAPTETTVPEGPMFGDAPWPCGAGDGTNTDDGSTPGVTKDTIRIAGGDDAGYAGAPGLNREMSDALRAMVAECNDLGGINGRQITWDYYDAALFNVCLLYTSDAADE